MKAYLYCDKRSLNDATNFYVGMIKESLNNLGYIFIICHKIQDIKSADLIITITDTFFFKAKLFYPFKKTIYWAQGVSADEAKMNGISGVKNFIRYIFHILAEFLSVRTCSMLLSVSDRMNLYFKEKYGYNSNHNVIVPCFNMKLSEMFNLEQYSKPSFVYAGSASVWQCVDIMLDVYEQIEKQISHATITILSADKSSFEEKIRMREIKNYEIKYVPQYLLNEELHKYKYGFLLRENHIVNNVATPTKMNSYLSNFIIPIYSNAVDDFCKNISLEKFSLIMSCPLSVDSITDKIITFERNTQNFKDYKNIVEKIFYTHYNRLFYIGIITKKIQEIGL
ncbi:MAG: hypothetical protein IJ328_00085 [Muribaculaceae bacterium]|nr:hypothetical protein [Muribaculaceae bacterium]